MKFCKSLFKKFNIVAVDLSSLEPARKRLPEISSFVTWPCLLFTVRVIAQSELKCEE